MTMKTKKRKSKWTRAERIRMAKMSRESLNEIDAEQGIALHQMEVAIMRVDEHLAVTGKTQYELAAAAGIANDGYRKSWWGRVRSRVLSNEYNPQLRTILRLSKATEMSLIEMFTPYPDQKKLRSVS